MGNAKRGKQHNSLRTIAPSILTTHHSTAPSLQLQDENPNESLSRPKTSKMSSRPKMAIEYPSLPGLSGELRWDIWGEVAQSTARIARLGREYYNESLPETPLLRVSKEARSAILTRLKPVIVGPNGDKLLLNMSKDILYLPRYNPVSSSKHFSKCSRDVVLIGIGTWLRDA